MTPDSYADQFSVSLDMFEATRPRSMQTQLGASSIGHCHQEAVYLLRGETPTDYPPARQALHGTAIHELYAKARKAFNPSLIVDAEVKITLPSGIVVVGHPDEIDPDEPSVTDLKSVGDESDVALQRRTGSSDQQKFQRHLYYFGAHQAGLVPAEGIVRNVWIDRAGREARPLVEQEPFSMDVVHAADAWLEDSRYAAEHGEDGLREKHFDWCKRFCPFFSKCRETEHSDFVVSDPELTQAAAVLFEARAGLKESGALEKAAKRILEPLREAADGDVAAYVAGDHRVRWVKINHPETPYWKCQVENISGDAA